MVKNISSNVYKTVSRPICCTVICKEDRMRRRLIGRFKISLELDAATKLFQCCTFCWMIKLNYSISLWKSQIQKRKNVL